MDLPMPVIVEETINAPVSSIWNALTEESQMKLWYFDVQDYLLIPGHTFYFYEPGENKKFLHQCKILDIVPERKFTHTWTYPEFSKGVSIVTWQLVPEGDHRTEVLFTHVNVEDFEEAGSDFARENFEAGWDEIVRISLKKFVEKQHIH